MDTDTSTATEVAVNDQDNRGDDWETVPAGEVVDTDRPVDPPPLPRTWATLAAHQQVTRPPIVPAWLRSARDARAVARWLVGLAGYAAAWHTTRLPKYALLTAMWAPVGLWRATWRFGRWIADADNRIGPGDPTRASNPEAARRLAELHDRHVYHRLVGLLVGAALVFAAGCLAVWLTPTWAQVTVGVVAAVGLAWYGRPADKPILDRVSIGPKFVRLTAENVRAALCSLSLAGLKDPASVTFPVEISRDGPGHLARVNLPQGTEAVDVIERRGKLSSALRLPVDQVWPSAGPDHAGQLDLWVGHRPASKLGQPRWSLAAPTARTSVFEPAEFGTDQRQRPVSTVLFERNFLIGGVPGSGKSYAARTLALIAALDPTCELKIAELKGTADFGDLAPLCTSYVCGIGDQDLDDAGRIILWGLAEAERRGERIRKARERGEAPEGKVTPELARRHGSGLHPVLILIDEAHELLVDKQVAAAAERLIKRGRALGLIVVLATQTPDRNSVPPAISRCVNSRWCLAVVDHIANDQILGTGSYKRGVSATVYRPGQDAGWGMFTGLAEPTPVRSHFPDPATVARIIARAGQLRGGVVVGDQDPAGGARRDILADVIRVWASVDRPALHWPTLATKLAAELPEAYGEVTPEALSALLRNQGVPSSQVKIDGRNARGVRREHVQAAYGRRQVGSGRGDAGSGDAT